jgi:hypothetical protein
VPSNPAISRWPASFSSDQDLTSISFQYHHEAGQARCSGIRG